MSIGIWQLILILLIILLLFGSGKLPKVMNDFAEGLKNMKKTLKNDSKNTSDKINNKEEKNKENED
jgi:sec-independent protein translocase protein TatA